ncbi:hypothetical protein OEZ85_012806 [Tetradesmus obliquus]|uniref:Aquaporin n=1 Tax=Tetradesmus obliquus TaxID=3088 RepID=A0ABY8U7V1_TETOB|nr:hypothetical protein OEZ85_012806 [Tetradesmus obliquus]
MTTGRKPNGSTLDHPLPKKEGRMGLLHETKAPGGALSLLAAGLAEHCDQRLPQHDTARQSGATDQELETVEPGACFLGSTNLLNIAMAFGLSIFVLVYAAASFSGGHLNPAITIAMFLTSRVSLVRAAVYIICQLAGLLYEALAYRAPLFGGPVEEQGREPGTSPAGPQEYTA